MSDESHARNAQLRAIAIYARRPDRAQETNRGRAELRHGLTCHYEQDGHSIAMNMPASVGGDGHGPTPGFFGRAALCGCLAIGIKMAAVREHIRLDMVRVDIEQDWDNRGLLGVEGACAEPKGTRIAIGIVSPERTGKIEGLVARALRHDPWLLAFRDAQPVSTTLSIEGECG